ELEKVSRQLILSKKLVNYLLVTTLPCTTLFRSSAIGVLALLTTVGLVAVGATPSPDAPAWLLDVDETLFGIAVLGGAWTTGRAVDRKSTRLNSSHVKISYADFCLKKKKKSE